VSAANGAYGFAGLQPGVHEVRDALQPGYSQTVPAGNGTYTVIITDSENVPDRDFGNVRSAEMTGRRIFYDNSMDG